jgi:hypothetical protein
VIETFFGGKTMKESVVPLLIPIYSLNSHEAWVVNDLDHPDVPMSFAIDSSSAAPTFFP